MRVIEQNLTTEFKHFNKQKESFSDLSHLSLGFKSRRQLIPSRTTCIQSIVVRIPGKDSHFCLILLISIKSQELQIIKIHVQSDSNR